MKYEKEYNQFLTAWGIEAQTNMAIEEMSELTKELCKLNRAKNDPEKAEKVRKNIQEEIADVLNMVEQLQLFYGKDEIDKQRDYKINRTQERLSRWG